MKNIITVITIGILFSSCSHVKSLMSLASLKKTKPVVKPMQVKGKEVRFIKMRHIGKPAFYSNIKLVVDSLVNNEYVVYAEGAGGIKRNGNLSQDTVTALKKFRKIFGLDLTIEYTKVKQMEHFVKKNGYIFQPKIEYFTNASNYKNVDISYTSLIQQYEEQYGEIVLDSCDLNTELGTLQNPCNSLGKEKLKIFNKEFVMGARNKQLAKTIKESTDKKILVMYGAKHFKGVKKELRKLKK